MKYNQIEAFILKKQEKTKQANKETIKIHQY